jgi:hypothetical protein
VSDVASEVTARSSHTAPTPARKRHSAAWLIPTLVAVAAFTVVALVVFAQ